MTMGGGLGSNVAGVGKAGESNGGEMGTTVQLNNNKNFKKEYKQCNVCH